MVVVLMLAKQPIKTAVFNLVISILLFGFLLRVKVWTPLSYFPKYTDKGLTCEVEFLTYSYLKWNGSVEN